MAREMKDSGIAWIGEIPEGWKMCRIKDIFILRTGTTPKDYEKWLDSDSLVNWFTPSDISEMNCELYSSERHLSKKVVINENIKLHPVDSLLFVGIGASAGKIGFAKVESYSNQQITNLVPKKEKCYSKYFYYYMLADRKRIRDNAFFTTLPIINNSYLSNISILSPSIIEQRAIADYLDRKCEEIDELISLQEKIIEELMAYKQSVITEAVTKGLNPNARLVPSGIDWIGDVPEGWKVCRIKDMVNLQSGTNLTSTEFSDSGIYPVYGGNGLRGYYEDYSNDGEYILIGRQGALCGNINYASGKFWATEHAVVCYPKRAFARIWLGELLRAMNLGQYSLSSAQPGLAVERIKNLKMPLPPITEQQTIASYLNMKYSEIDALITLKQQKIETLNDYKKSIIYECVAGKTEIA